MKKNIAIMFFLLSALAVVTVIMYPKIKERKNLKINSFEECVKAGFPVLESYPSECSLPNGKIFVESVVPER